MRYKIEDVRNYVAAPYVTDKIFSPISIVWGSGDAEEYDVKQLIYHNYETPGTYSLTVQCHDVNEFSLNPVGDLEFLDLTSF